MEHRRGFKDVTGLRASARRSRGGVVPAAVRGSPSGRQRCRGRDRGAVAHAAEDGLRYSGAGALAGGLGVWVRTTHMSVAHAGGSGSPARGKDVRFGHRFSGSLASVVHPCASHFRQACGPQRPTGFHMVLYPDGVSATRKPQNGISAAAAGVRSVRLWQGQGV